jgi:hypothetical protein
VRHVACITNICNVRVRKHKLLHGLTFQQKISTEMTQEYFFAYTFTPDLELRKKLAKCYVWSITLYGAETWMLRAVDQKHLESFEMLCWRRMEKIIWTDHV